MYNIYSYFPARSNYECRNRPLDTMPGLLENYIHTGAVPLQSFPCFFSPTKELKFIVGGDFTCAAITMSQPLRWIRARLLFWHSSHEMQLKICIYPAPLHYLNYPQRSPLTNSSRKGSDCFINNNRKKPLELTGKIQIMLHLQVTHSTSLTPTTLKPS